MANKDIHIYNCLGVDTTSIISDAANNAELRQYSEQSKYRGGGGGANAKVDDDELPLISFGANGMCFCYP